MLIGSSCYQGIKREANADPARALRRHPTGNRNLLIEIPMLVEEFQ
jgi:hypothetical protein